MAVFVFVVESLMKGNIVSIKRYADKYIMRFFILFS